MLAQILVYYLNQYISRHPPNFTLPKNREKSLALHMINENESLIVDILANKKLPKLCSHLTPTSRTKNTSSLQLMTHIADSRTPHTYAECMQPISATNNKRSNQTNGVAFGSSLRVLQFSFVLPTVNTTSRPSVRSFVRPLKIFSWRIRFVASSRIIQPPFPGEGNDRSS